MSAKAVDVENLIGIMIQPLRCCTCV